MAIEFGRVPRGDIVEGGFPGGSAGRTCAGKRTRGHRARSGASSNAQAEAVVAITMETEVEIASLT